MLTRAEGKSVDKEKQEYFKVLLSKQLKDKEETLKMMKDHQMSKQSANSSGELSNYDNHPAEMATELYNVEFNNGLLVHEEYQLRLVREALGKIEKDRYGICDFCGKDIDVERLEVIPYAKSCIDCEKINAASAYAIKNDRPNEELVVDSPFGRKYLNKREDDENEGLDILNDLMKYGSSDTPQDLGGYHDYKDFYTNDTDRQGIVDDMDQVSNDEYKRQLPE
jgi:YteA family regulatory protein